jgi:hypothetical protein
MRTSSYRRTTKIQDSAPEVFDEGAANAKNLGKPGLSVGLLFKMAIEIVDLPI